MAPVECGGNREIEVVVAGHGADRRQLDLERPVDLVVAQFEGRATPVDWDFEIERTLKRVVLDRSLDPEGSFKYRCGIGASVGADGVSDPLGAPQRYVEHVLGDVRNRSP